MDGGERKSVEEPSAKRLRHSAGASASASGDSGSSGHAPAAFAVSADGEDGAPVASLPRDLLSHVLGLLDVAERSRASRVCRRWRAAALEPPHSTRLSLRLRHMWHTHPCVDGAQWEARAAASVHWPAAAWAPDPTALTEAELRLALRSPPAMAVEKLIVVLGRAAGPPKQDSHGRREWPIRALLEALPRSVTSLEIAKADDVFPIRHSATAFDPFRDDEAAVFDYILSEEQRCIFVELGMLQDLAPQLRQLVVRGGKPRLMPAICHEALERLDAGLLAFPRGLLELPRGLPSLRRLGGLDLSGEAPLTEDLCSTLTALVERGLRVRSLRVGDLDYKGICIVDALSAMLEPKAPGFDFCSGPATLDLNLDEVPRNGLPDAFGADVEQIIFHSYDPPEQATLPWLTRLSRRSSLQVLELHIRDADRQCASPHELLAAFRGCREGLRIELHWPGADSVEDWSLGAGLADACEFVAQDRALLRAVSIRVKPLDRLHTKSLAAYLHYAADRFDALAADRALDRDEVREFLCDFEEVKDFGLAACEAFERRAAASGRWGVPAPADGDGAHMHPAPVQND